VDSEEGIDGETLVDRTTASSKDGLLATEVSVRLGTSGVASGEHVTESCGSRRCSDSDGGLSECDNAHSLSDSSRHRHQHALKVTLAKEGE
jgi:hypothetical protein